MYQKHEFIIKKNQELMDKYEEIKTQMYEEMSLSISEEAEYIESKFSTEELECIARTERVMDFINVDIRYYLDVLNLFKNFIYEPEISLTFGDNEGMEAPYVTYTEKREETDDEIRIVIEEYWNNRFECQCLNPYSEDGFSNFTGCCEVPLVIRKLYNNIEGHTYLQREYSENHEVFGDEMYYSCVSRFFDECPNGEGAIGIYDHEDNKYKIYGYGMAHYGWGAKPLEGHITDRSILERNPEKVWRAVNPKLSWYCLDTLDENIDLCEMYDKMFTSFPEKYHDRINENTEGFEDYDYLYEMFYFWYDYSVEGWEHTEYSERCNAFLTGAEILSFIDVLENTNKIFIETQQAICKADDIDYNCYGDENFVNHMLFVSDDNELLYVESEDVSEDGMKTGKINLHYKKF